MADRAGALEGLRPRERERLDRFARAFDRIDASAYHRFAEVTVDDNVRAAQDAALEAIGDGVRRAAVRAVVDSFVDAAAAAYSRRTLASEWLIQRSLPDRAEDRARFAASVERAVVGLILWDELDDEDLGALIGLWAPYVDGDGDGEG